MTSRIRTIGFAIIGAALVVTANACHDAAGPAHDLPDRVSFTLDTPTDGETVAQTRVSITGSIEAPGTIRDVIVTPGENVPNESAQLTGANSDSTRVTFHAIATLGTAGAHDLSFRVEWKPIGSESSANLQAADTTIHIPVYKAPVFTVAAPDTVFGTSFELPVKLTDGLSKLVMIDSVVIDAGTTARQTIRSETDQSNLSPFLFNRFSRSPTDTPDVWTIQSVALSI